MIMKLPIDALYIKLSYGIKDISVAFKKIFWSITVVEMEEFDSSEKFGFNFLIVDARGVLVDIENALLLTGKITSSSVKALLIYDKSNEDKIGYFIDSGVEFFLPYPTTRERLKNHLQRMINTLSLENRLQECQRELEYCNVEVKDEDLSKESCLELQKHIQIVEGYVKKTCRESEVLIENILTMNRLLVQSDLSERNITFLGSALQSITQLQNSFDELEKVIVPEEKFIDSHKVPFNINAVLENISIIMSKYWGDGKLNLIFNISNSVPARILANPILLSKVLVGILEIIVDIKKRGEIVLDVSTQEEDDRELIYFNPLKYMDLTPEQSQKLQKVFFKPRFLRIKNIVDMMSGEFESRDGEIIGLGFHIPLVRLDRRNYRLPSRKWMDKSVLVIEKNSFVGNALSEMLRYFHYDVDKTDNMQDAENKLYHKTYDLIFLDEELFDSFEIYGYPLKRDAKVIVMAWPSTQKTRISDYLAKLNTVMLRPFTQQKVFDTILELYSNEAIKEHKESLAIMKENLGFLLHGKKALYVGDNDNDWLLIRSLLKGSLLGIQRVESVSNVDKKIKVNDLIILSSKIYEDKKWRSWLKDCKKRCENKNVIALVEYLNPKLIKGIKAVGIHQYLTTPINPENFYRILMEELMT